MASFSIEGICNQALDLLGHPRHIGNLYDGTRESRVALNLWAQTRDALFQAKMPDWARKDVGLTLLRSAPNIINGMADYTGIVWNANQYPEIPWLYEYQYPSDCIEALQIKSSPGLLPVWRPRYKPFRLVFDATTARSILSNEPNAILIYVSRVVDPNNWQTDFIEMMVLTLAKKFEAEFAQESARPQRQQQGQVQNANSAG